MEIQTRTVPTPDVLARLVSTAEIALLDGTKEATWHKRLQRGITPIDPYRVQVGGRVRLRWDPIELAEATGR
ncbi:MAG: hypothetical protein AAF517_04560 [Planctomycetota bacterium]